MTRLCPRAKVARQLAAGHRVPTAIAAAIGRLSIAGTMAVALSIIVGGAGAFGVAADEPLAEPSVAPSVAPSVEPLVEPTEVAIGQPTSFAWQDGPGNSNTPTADSVAAPPVDSQRPVGWPAEWPASPANWQLPTPAESLAQNGFGPGPAAFTAVPTPSTALTPAPPTAAPPTAAPLNAWLAISLLSLAPAALLMTTSYVRIAAVLGLLRQALGMPQLPSTSVMSSLALFMTFLVMAPVWTEVYEEAIVPARDPERRMTWEEFWVKGSQPLRRFMSRQIDRADNSEDVWLFYRHLPESRTGPPPSTYDDVPLTALLPAFLLSELKIAFLIGFQICLPFLVVDLVVASMTTALGMMMVPTQSIALPMKLLLFVLLDGWRLVVGLLLESFQTYWTPGCETQTKHGSVMQGT